MFCKENNYLYGSSDAQHDNLLPTTEELLEILNSKKNRQLTTLSAQDWALIKRNLYDSPLGKQVSLETSLRQYLDLVYVFSQDLCEREIAAAFLFNILWPTCCLLKKSLNDCNLSERLDLREIWVSNIFVKTALEHVIFSFGNKNITERLFIKVFQQVYEFYSLANSVLPSMFSDYKNKSFICCRRYAESIESYVDRSASTSRKQILVLLSKEEIRRLQASRFNTVAESFLKSPNESKASNSLECVAGAEVGLEVFDSNWLARRCALYAHQSNSEHSPHDLTVAVYKILQTQDVICAQSILVDMLGLSALDFISNILQKRDDILRITKKALKGVRAYRQLALQREAANPTSTIIGVTIKSKREHLMPKHLKKTNRLHGVALSGDRDFELKAALGLDNSFNADYLSKYTRGHSRRQRPQTPKYPHVYDERLHGTELAAYVGSSKLSLPANAERVQTNLYESITIPAPAAAPPESFEFPISIEALSPLSQLVFKGIKELNRIQSIVYPAAYYSNENLLICAPTGAGKTNIALMAIVRAIEQNMVNEVVQLKTFKIVYVAPMKALASEMTQNFGRRLTPLGVAVRELTGDMQLSRAEVKNTQVIVTTPEKWDVITRKSVGDTELSQLVQLLIIDEVHLLHDERGSVVESLVARTLRQVETSQRMVRLVGLSATLPNYLDVAQFLRVNFFKGLFFFDGRFRPVPLTQTFVGVKGNSPTQVSDHMNEVCFEKVLKHVETGDQVMVFVHSRNDTVKTAEALLERARNIGREDDFAPPELSTFSRKLLLKSPNRTLQNLGPCGVAVHHAGMLRSDRNLVERLFSEGQIRVLCCTATLAWGVNLPAHAVIIKGTSLYDSRTGGFRDLGVLDVQQIFGRAGRPQFDSFGEAYILTPVNKLPHYITALTTQTPIESQFIKNLADHLNAEVSLGTVANVDDAVQWLSYTFLYVRLKRNPLNYGVTWSDGERDPTYAEPQRKWICTAAQLLDDARMVRYNSHTGFLSPTDLGRIGSHFYISAASIMRFNELFKEHMNTAEILGSVSKFTEFANIQLRREEEEELDELRKETVIEADGGVESTHGKVNTLLQCYIGRVPISGFSLASDTAYIAQNSSRILRAIFELCLRRNQPIATQFLELSKCVHRQQWPFETPLRQFGQLKYELIDKLESKKFTLPQMRELTSEDLGHLVRHVQAGPILKKYVSYIPHLNIKSLVQPITRTILRVELRITPCFQWNDTWHSPGEPWWILVEDPSTDHLYHTEYVVIHKKNRHDTQQLVFTVPLFEPLSSQYYVRAVSEKWLGALVVEELKLDRLRLPLQYQAHTPLLNLCPLPISALQNIRYQAMYKFQFFNPLQTQFFHTVYHTDENILIGAPTGSGKTVAAELALFRLFNNCPGCKAVYIAPLKALVKERVINWSQRLVRCTDKVIVELTGDVSPDLVAIERADLIVTTPEKWDGVSRSWQSRSYVKKVALIIIDEIHMLGEERGPVLEIIVSRFNYISFQLHKKIRFVGLSTALANAHDLAHWLGVKNSRGLYNFRPSVRPVPLEVHIEGFPGRHYCPRMATMNRPTYAAILTHSRGQPTLVFVSSRRQTRLTALDLISFSVADDRPKQFLTINEKRLESLLQNIVDTTLRHTLSFGVGLHHAGLVEGDRRIVEELFCEQRILVLVATATLAWGVNLPAHLVVVKGTEFFDAKTKKYKDFPVTDVLQMMGRAGRPQFDESATAVILVHDTKKHFYKKFLYEPFPVESKLADVLADHLNAEIVSGSVFSKQSAVEFLTWTYFFRRLAQNPSFYGLERVDQKNMNYYLSKLIQNTIAALQEADCCVVNENDTITPTTLGAIASFYYLKHSTVGMLSKALVDKLQHSDLLRIMSNASEFAEVPVRHNEEHFNAQLAAVLPWKVGKDSYDSPHTKANLLLQARFERCELPVVDYQTDTKTVLDQTFRVLQAMIDIASGGGYFVSTHSLVGLLQMVVQARWIHENSLLTIPGVEESHLPSIMHMIGAAGNACQSPVVSDGLLRELCKFYQANDKSRVTATLQGLVGPRVSLKITEFVEGLPAMELTAILCEDSIDEPLRFQKEYVLKVFLINKNKKSLDTIRPYQWPRDVPVQWILVLQYVQGDALLAMKRIKHVRNKTTIALAFSIPRLTGVELGRITIQAHLFSTCFLGLNACIAMNFLIN